MKRLVRARLRTIGVGAGKYLGVRRIFAQISPNLPKNFWATFSANISHEDQKNDIHVILQTLRNSFFKSNHIGCNFCSYFEGVYPDFLGFCKGFNRFCPDLYGFFPGILPGFSPNKNFWGCTFTPCNPASYTTGEDKKARKSPSAIALKRIKRYLGQH